MPKRVLDGEGTWRSTKLSEPPSRAPAQRQRVLDLLRERGAAGATNRELNQIGFRYGARLWELKRQGFSIRTDRLTDTLFRFVLLAEPQQPKLLPSYRRKRPASQRSLFAGVAR